MIDFAPFARFGVLLVRPGMLIATAPPFGGQMAPPLVKIGLTVLLALMLLPIGAHAAPVGVDALALVLAREVAIGLALAMAARIVVAAAEVAGSLIGFQLAFSYATVIDPQSGARNNMTSGFYAMLATLTFLAVNGHHVLIRGLAASYEALPIGPGHVDESLVGAVGQILTVIFMVGAELAAPIIVVMLVVEVAIGLLARMSPMLNMMTAGFAIKLLVGLFVLGQTISVVPQVVAAVLGSAVEAAMNLTAALR